MIDEVKKGGCSLVPKFPKGVSISKRDVAWRCTFNNAEKMLLLDSNPRTADNCRRPVLRILKSLRVDYGWPEIRSYHLKTLMLHEFESHHPSEWKDNKMLPLLKQALQRLKVFLENKNCPHYFLQGINLFEGFNREACKQIIQDIDRFLENPKQALEMLNRNVSTGSVRAGTQIYSDDHALLHTCTPTFITKHLSYLMVVTWQTFITTPGHTFLACMP